MADEPRRWRGWLESDIDAHPDAPSGGSGPGSSRLPSVLGPLSSTVGRSHPDAPAARLDSWAPHASGSPGPDRGSTGLGQHGEVEKFLQAQASALRELLPDPSLIALFINHLDRLRAGYGEVHNRNQSPGQADVLLRRIHKSIAWIDPALFGGSPESGAFRAAAGPPRALGALPRGESEAEFRAFESIAGRVFEAAAARLRERWADAVRGGAGQQEALLSEWRHRLDSQVIARPSGSGERAVRQSTRPMGDRMPPPPPRVKTWVEFQMVDEDGQPVPYVAYDVTLPDGARRTGRLDAKGKVRFDSIDPGQCLIKFPEIDGREWRPA
jgi:hypothetical protein